jgi:hypothetical protein
VHPGRSISRGSGQWGHPVSAGSRDHWRQELGSSEGRASIVLLVVSLLDGATRVMLLLPYVRGNGPPDARQASGENEDGAPNHMLRLFFITGKTEQNEGGIWSSEF